MTVPDSADTESKDPQAPSPATTPAQGGPAPLPDGQQPMRGLTPAEESDPAYVAHGDGYHAHKHQHSQHGYHHHHHQHEGGDQEHSHQPDDPVHESHPDHGTLHPAEGVA